MPITLAEAKELSQNKLTQYVIDEFRQSALLDLITFDDTVKPGGGQTLSYSYNRVTTLPTAATRALNNEYVPSEAKTTQKTVNLKILGGSFQVDRVIENHEKQVLSHIMFQLGQKIKATRALFHDMFINGNEGGDATQFDGIDRAVTGSTTELIPAAAIDLSSSANITTNWQLFLDTLRKLRAKLDDAPTLYLMNGDMFSVFQSVMDRAGINLASKQNYGDEVVQWGKSFIMALGDKPGTANPIIPTTNGETAIYPVRLGLDGVHGVSPEGTGGEGLLKVYLPNMKLPGAVKTGEVEMVAAVAVKATRSAGVLRKIKIA
jgi:hypothetical protein